MRYSSQFGAPSARKLYPREEDLSEKEHKFKAMVKTQVENYIHEK